MSFPHDGARRDRRKLLAAAGAALALPFVGTARAQGRRLADPATHSGAVPGGAEPTASPTAHGVRPLARPQ